MHQELMKQLVTSAVLGTDHPSEAAALLMRAAADILVRDFGTEIAIEAMRTAIDDAAANWARLSVN